MLSTSVLGQRIFLRNYSETEGLPGSTVFDVFEAPNGEIWFATRTALHAYDGTRWREVFRTRGGNPVRFIRSDEAGRIWILCENGAIFQVTDQGMEPHASFANLDSALNVLDFEVAGSGDSLRFVVSTALRGVEHWHAGEWRVVTWENRPLLGTPVASWRGQLLVGGDTGLLTLERDASLSPLLIAGLPPGIIHGLVAESPQCLWIHGGGWLGSLDESRSLRLLPAKLPKLNFGVLGKIAVVGDGAGGVLISNSLLMIHIDGETGELERLDRRHGLISDGGAVALIRDRRGTLWGAGGSGAFSIFSLDARVYGKQHGLAKDEVTAVAQLKDGRMVLGHNGALSLQEGDGWRKLEFLDTLVQSPMIGRIMDLTVDRAGTLWIAAAGFGLGRLDEAEELHWLEPQGDQLHWANTVHQQGDGSLLVGTTDGLFRLVDDVLVPHEEDALGASYIRRIEVGADDSLYVATATGALVRRAGEWRRVTEQGVPDQRGQFFTVLEDNRGRVWFGASDGMLRLEGDALVRIGVSSGLGRPVYSLVMDASDRLWMGTDFGFLWAEKGRLMPLDWMATHTGQEANRAAALIDDMGRVWMGTTSGVTVFAPDFDFPSEAPALELLGSTGEDSDWNPARSLRLSSQRATEFRVGARAEAPFIDGLVRWRYRIEGYLDWQERVGSTVLELHYAWLPPGSYRFEVQASLPGGKFGPVLRSAEIEVIGPIWTRWWFFLLAILFSGTLTLLGYRALTIRRQAQRLEQEVSLKTNELELSLRELAKTDRLRSLGSLAAGIAHDYRNVLSVLTGNLSLMRKGLSANPKQLKFLDEADLALARALQLSQQLQTFATGGEPIKADVDLHVIAQECVSLLLSGSPVEVELDFEAGLWDVFADEGQLRQVFENLLLNARQCQPQGGLVHLQARNLTLGEQQLQPDGTLLPPGRYVHITLRDAGPGVARDVRDHIFEPFFSTRSGGAGLGLATSHSVIQRHGGSLVLEDPRSVGRGAAARLPGACFHIHLPTPIREANLKRTEHEPTTQTAGETRVLIMDDEEPVRRVLGLMLERLGFVVVATEGCTSAEEALRRSLEEGQRFACAILDLTVPGDLPGAEILERLHGIDAELRAAAISGYSKDPVLARPMDFGFHVAISKPFTFRDLSAALEELGVAARAASVPDEARAQGGRG